MPEIVIEIGKNGQVQVEGHGFSGAECETLAKDLAEALGDVEQIVLKPEYHREIANVRTVQS